MPVTDSRLSPNNRQDSESASRERTALLDLICRIEMRRHLHGLPEPEATQLLIELRRALLMLEKT